MSKYDPPKCVRCGHELTTYETMDNNFGWCHAESTPDCECCAQDAWARSNQFGWGRP